MMSNARTRASRLWALRLGRGSRGRCRAALERLRPQAPKPCHAGSRATCTRTRSTATATPHRTTWCAGIGSTATSFSCSPITTSSPVSTASTRCMAPTSSSSSSRARSSPISSATSRSTSTASTSSELVTLPGGQIVLEMLQRMVDAIRAARGVPSINHPNFGWAISADELIQLQRTRLFEVFNGHPLVNNLGGGGVPGLEEMWDRMLSSGKLMYGIAVDDAHYFKAPGDPNVPGPGPGMGLHPIARASRPARSWTRSSAASSMRPPGVELVSLEATKASMTIDDQRGIDGALSNAVHRQAGPGVERGHRAAPRPTPSKATKATCARR